MIGLVRWVPSKAVSGVPVTEVALDVPILDAICCHDALCLEEGIKLSLRTFFLGSISVTYIWTE